MSNPFSSEHLACIRDDAHHMVEGTRDHEDQLDGLVSRRMELRITPPRCPWRWLEATSTRTSGNASVPTRCVEASRMLRPPVEPASALASSTSRQTG